MASASGRSPWPSAPPGAWVRGRPHRRQPAQAGAAQCAHRAHDAANGVHAIITAKERVTGQSAAAEAAPIESGDGRQWVAADG